MLLRLTFSSFLTSLSRVKVISPNFTNDIRLLHCLRSKRSESKEYKVYLYWQPDSKGCSDLAISFSTILQRNFNSLYYWSITIRRIVIFFLLNFSFHIDILYRICAWLGVFLLFLVSDNYSRYGSSFLLSKLLFVLESMLSKPVFLVYWLQFNLSWNVILNW